MSNFEKRLYLLTNAAATRLSVFEGTPNELAVHSVVNGLIDDGSHVVVEDRESVCIALKKLFDHMREAVMCHNSVIMCNDITGCPLRDAYEETCRLLLTLPGATSVSEVWEGSIATVVRFQIGEYKFVYGPSIACDIFNGIEMFTDPRAYIGIIK